MTHDPHRWPGADGPPFAARPAHRRWLTDRALALLAFHGPRGIDPRGGFLDLGPDGAPLPDQGARPLHGTTRMVHCHCIGHMLGIPGAADVVDHGIRTLARHHRDARHGGWHWSFDAHGPAETGKHAYGHAFVLLAGASAAMAGHPDGAALLAEAAEIHERHFWDEAAGAGREDFAADWSDPEPYRGQNSNMHLTEALMAAHEATGERVFLDRARRIAERLIDRNARAAGWAVPEHHRADWSEWPDYEGESMFRPSGTTPGHALEWARLLTLLHGMGGGGDWMPEAARALFDTACAQGWDAERGGFVYTLDRAGAVTRPLRLW